MKLVKCGKCGAQFDVAAMRPGTTFACGKCRNAVSVPGEAAPATMALSPEQMKKALEEARAAAAPAPAAAAPKAQPKLPPAMQARAHATSASAPTRASGSSPAPAAAPAAAPQVATKAAPAPRAARTREPSAEPEKKSPAMTYAIIGGIVVAGVIVAVVMSGGDKPKETAAQKPVEAPKPAEAPAAPVKPKDPTNVDDYLSMPAADQHNSLVSRFVSTGNDATQLLHLFEWCKDPKLAGNEDAKVMKGRIVEAALKADQDCEWARLSMGDRRIRDLLQPCHDECPLSFTMPDPPEQEINERLATMGAKPWADAAEWAKWEGVVKTVREREAKFKANPRYVMAEKKRDWIRQGNEFKGVEMTWTFADPYVLFQEVKKEDVRDTKRVKKEDVEVEEPIDGTSNPSKVSQNETWKKKGDLFVKRDGIIFNELNRRFRELFAEELKLEPLETCGPDHNGRVLTGVVMWNRQSFDKLASETGNPVPPGIRAFYSPPQQKIFHYIGEESLQGSDEIPVAGGYVQKQSDQVTFHEGTHQLQHEYTAILSGHPLTDGAVVVNGNRCMWFEEGIAEFMGAAEIEASKAEYLEGGKWRHNRVLLDRIQESRLPQFRDTVGKWDIKDFLKCTSNQDLQTIGQKLVPTDSNMPSHFYCRAWAFCHFLWYYDNGKYRPQFLHFLHDIMTSSWSTDKFAKYMGRPNANDWGPVEKEFEWYWGKLLLRDVRRLESTGQWKSFTSDEPTGKVEDDTDFCETWDEAHKAGKKEEPKPEAPATTPPPKDAPKPPKK